MISDTHTPAATESLWRAVRLPALRPRQVSLALWLGATLLYGAAAGAVLYKSPYVAGAVLSVIWLAATWRGRHLFGSDGLTPPADASQ